MNENKKSSIFKLHFAVMLFGFVGVIGKYVTWSSVAVTFGRVFSSAVFLIIFMSLRREKIKMDSRNDYILVIAAGIVMAIHWTSFIHSIQVSSVAIGTITFAAFPLFVTFLEPLIFKEKLKMRNVVIAVIMIIGVFITIPEFSLGNRSTVGIIWGMIGSFTYAVMSLMNRSLSAKYPGRQVCLYEQGTASVVLAPFLLTASVSFTVPEVSSVIFMGIVCTAVAHSIFIGSLKDVKVQTAGVISGMETVYSIVFAIILLGDVITVREIIGGAVILLAAAYKTVRID